MSGLHAANVLQTSDVVRSAEAGLVIGAAVGALLGVLVAVFYPIVGDKPQWGLAAVLAIAGALVRHLDLDHDRRLHAEQAAGALRCRRSSKARSC